MIAELYILPKCCSKTVPRCIVIHIFTHRHKLIRTACLNLSLFYQFYYCCCCSALSQQRKGNSGTPIVTYSRSSPLTGIMSILQVPLSSYLIQSTCYISFGLPMLIQLYISRVHFQFLCKCRLNVCRFQTYNITSCISIYVFFSICKLWYVLIGYFYSITPHKKQNNRTQH